MESSGPLSDAAKRPLTIGSSGSRAAVNSVQFATINLTVGKRVGDVAVGLAADCEAYVGRQILVEPQYGYGWNSQVATAAGTYTSVEVPPRFHFVIDRFFRNGGSLMGGIGTVTEPGHPFDGLKIGFSARHKIDRDFVRDPVICNLTIGAEENVSSDGWLLAVGPPALVGFGQLRDDAF